MTHTVSTGVRRPAPTTRHRRRDWLALGVWLAIAGAFSFMVADGALLSDTPMLWLNVVGRIFGITAAVLMMVQLLLASRAPWINRTVGYDKAIALHARYGESIIVLMIVHVAIVNLTNAVALGHGYVGQFLMWWNASWFMRWAVIGFALMIVIMVSSLAVVRARMPYHRWHVVHLVSYGAVVFSIPHMYLYGGTFRDVRWSRIYWTVLWAFTVGTFVVYRFLQPLYLRLRYRPTVAAVRREPDGSTTVTIDGRGLGRLGAQAGQFFLWSFGRLGFAREAHPYSLSEAPTNTFRITVKPLGDASGAMAKLKPGTSVWMQGPLGVFTSADRVGHESLLVGSGIGVTPILSLLQSADPTDRVTVVLRARSRDEAPLINEVEHAAARVNARCVLSLGPRGDTWGSVSTPLRINELVTSPEHTDVYICGPKIWADNVAADARAAGVPAEGVHREEFEW